MMIRTKNEVRERKCKICGEVKRTTNDEEPFVCEMPCLRITARKLLLSNIGAAIGFIVVGSIVIGFVLGRVYNLLF